MWGNIHLVDNIEYLQQHPRGSENYDRLFKLRPVLDCLRRTFKSNYNLHQNVSIDEAMVKGKGKNPIQQYMPMKPIKRGTKIWCLGDSESGYLYDIQVYAGKEGIAGEVGLGGRVVKDLVMGLSGRNHVLYLDNFFTSIPLAKQMILSGIYMCGTIRSNKKGFAVALKDQRLLASMKERGDFHTHRIENELSVATWKDTKLVSFITNVSPPRGNTTIERKKKDGRRLNIPCPPCVLLYNKYMGAVDRCDAAVRPYAVDRKCKRWWLRPFLSLALDRVRTNAFILYNESFAKVPFVGKLYDHKQFVSELAKNLLGEQSFRRLMGQPTKAPPIATPLKRKHDNVHIVKLGLIAKGRCEFCCKNRGPNNRKETRMGCAECAVRLCPGECHSKYHRYKNPITNQNDSDLE